MADVITHETQTAQPGEFADYLKATQPAPGQKSAAPAIAPVAETETVTPPAEIAPTVAEPKPETWTDPETGEEVEGKKTRYQKRVERLWKERESANQRADRLESELVALRAQARTPAAVPPESPAAPQTAPDDELTAAARSRIRPEPDESQIGSHYRTYEAFVKDCAIWGGELATEKRALHADQQAAQTQATEAQTRFGQAVAAARTDYADFDEVVNADIPINQAIFDATVNAPPELSGHVLHYLGAHPDVTTRIAAMAPGPALVEMGKVLATVEAERGRQAAPAKPQNPTSRAPAPLQPVGRNGGAPTQPQDIADAGGSAVDFIRMRNEQTRRRL